MIGRAGPRISLLGCASLLFMLSPAAAQTGNGPGEAAQGASEAILIAQLVLLLFVGRGLGELMQRLGQPAVTGQLLAGLILGPSLFGWSWPSAHDVIFPTNVAQ